jgi:hypothetical protein
MAEVLTETYLYELGLSDDQVHDGMRKRDELLRQFARSVRRTGRRDCARFDGCQHRQNLA